MLDIHTAALPLLSESLARLTEKALAWKASDLPRALTDSLEQKLIIELTHGSTAIEGNTLTLRETQLLIEEGITPAGSKRLREIYETLNHHRAVNYLCSAVAKGEECTERSLQDIHRLIMSGIDEHAAGEYRTSRVMVTGAPLQPIRPELVSTAMSGLFAAISVSNIHPVLLAAEAHYRLVKIHPYYDGNGRTARLMMNWILLSRGYPLTVIQATHRARYITSLDDADRGHPSSYLQLICECVEQSLDAYLGE